MAADHADPWLVNVECLMLPSGDGQVSCDD